MNPLVLLLGVAFAGVDAHGPTPPPTDGDPARPARLTGGARLRDGSAGIVGEYANDPLNLFVQEGNRGPIRTVARIDDVALANVQLAQGFGRVGVGLVLPVVPYIDGPGEGSSAVADPRVSVPIAVADGDWGGLSLVPSVKLPIGAQRQYLGGGSPTAGVLAAATLRGGGFASTINAGVDASSTSVVDGFQVGGSTVGGGASVGWVFEGAGVGVHGELVGSYSLASVNGNLLPVELSGTVRGRHGPGWWVLGAGTGLTEGIGSAALRVFAGGGLRWGAPDEPELQIVEPEPVEEPPAIEPTEVTVAVRDVRGTPIEARVVFRAAGDEVDVDLDDGVGRASVAPGSWVVGISADGYGDQVRELQVSDESLGFEAILLEAMGDARVTVEVVDQQGRAAPSARVLLDGLPVGSVGQDSLTVGGLVAGEHQVAVRGHGFLGWEGVLSTDEPSSVLLHPVEGTLRVVVTDTEGHPVPDAWVAFSGPSRRAGVPLEGDRERMFVLSPGSWTALVSSEALGVQARDVVLEADAWTTTEARFVLGGTEAGAADLRVRVVDVDGLPVEGAVVTLGEGTLGETASGGDLFVSGVAVGARDLSVVLDGAEPVAAQEILLRPGLQEAWFTVSWLPGTVRLRVRHPDGPVDDAVVIGEGPEELPPRPLGPTGSATWRLAPGDWELVASSARWGTASREISLPDTGGSLHRVDIVLLPVGNAAGASRLALAVRDPDALAVVGAGVAVDGWALGTTTSGGFHAPITPGDRALEVRAVGFGPWDRDQAIQPGLNEVTAELTWSHMVRLTVLGADDQPVRDATVRLAGSGAVTPPAAVDGNGQRRIPASPGAWQAVAVSAEHGIGSTPFEIPVGAELVEHTIRLDGASDGQLVVEVRDSLDRVVPEATVGCEGCTPVEADQGVAVLTDVPAETTELTVEAPHHAPISLPIDPEMDRARVAVMAPDPIAVTVEVNGPAGEPLVAILRLEGPAQVDPVQTGPDGTARIETVPGRWTLTAEAEGLGVRRQELDLRAGSPPVQVELGLDEARVTVEGDVVRFTEKVHFDLGSAVLGSGSDAILSEVADTLIAHPELTVIEVQGHTDATGDLAVNQRLSDERAEAVRRALVEKGVAPSRLLARGYGPTRPIDSNDSEDGRSRNRRVQFAVVETSVQ